MNKVDDTTREHDIWAFERLGLGEPQPVSALHGRASGDLLDVIVARLPEDPAEAQAGGGSGEDGADANPSIFSVAIVGRPNAGKSTLFNRLVGEERSVVHDHPGTTRDSIDTIVDTESGPIRFVDTAGMRRKAKVDEPAEYFSLVRALGAIDRADACLLVIDATVGVTHQDQRLAERVDTSGCAVVVCSTSGTCSTPRHGEKVNAGVPRMLGFLSYAPVLPASALSGRRVHVLLPALREAQEAYERRIPTAELNRVLRDAQAGHPPPIMPRPPPACAVRNPGRGRAADHHAVCQRPVPADVPALSRAQDSRGLQARAGADQVAGASAQHLSDVAVPCPWFSGIPRRRRPRGSPPRSRSRHRSRGTPRPRRRSPAWRACPSASFWG